MKLQEKAKAENKEEVRNKSQQEGRKQLANYLQCKWRYANSSAYSKVFRQYKLLEMINEITFYLHIEEGGKSLLLKHEHYMLLSLIRGISAVIDQKTPHHKRILERRLKDFTDLSDEGKDEQ